MLRAAMALLSTLQIGAQIKTTIERTLRQTVVVVIAALIILAAIVFGLIAAYHALISIYEFSAAEAAAIMAACLLVLGVIVLAIASFIGREPAKRPREPPRRLPAWATARTSSTKASARPCSRSAPCRCSPSPSWPACSPAGAEPRPRKWKYRRKPD